MIKTILGFITGACIGSFATGMYFEHKIEALEESKESTDRCREKQIEAQKTRIEELEEETTKYKTEEVPYIEFEDQSTPDEKRKIYICGKKEFQNDEFDVYDRNMWTYWACNNIVSNEQDEAVTDYACYIGDEFKKVFDNNPKLSVIYIRNDELQEYYEIEKVKEYWDFSDEEGRLEER